MKSRSEAQGDPDNWNAALNVEAARASVNEPLTQLRLGAARQVCATLSRRERGQRPIGTPSHPAFAKPASAP